MNDLNEMTIHSVDTNNTQDDSLVLESVVNAMPYGLFTRDILVKPLPEVMVEKEITEPINMDINSADDLMTDYETKTELKKVPANFLEGIVLALPSGYQWPSSDHPEVGDRIVYPRKGMIYFDLFKDTQLINPYNVVAWRK